MEFLIPCETKEKNYWLNAWKGKQCNSDNLIITQGTCFLKAHPEQVINDALNCLGCPYSTRKIL